MSVKDFVVVGGSQGIGREIVCRLVERGHRVHVLSRTVGDTPMNDRVVHHIWDATRDEFPTAVLPESLAGFVYCPGSIQLRGFANFRLEQFREDLEINVLGCVKALQACLTPLKHGSSAATPAADAAAGRGAELQPSSVVLFSTVAVQLGMSMHSSIAMAKGAIEGLTRSLAAEWAPWVRVNAIAPALTETQLTQRFLATPEKKQSMSANYPLKRVGKPADIASAALYLLDPENSWITGQILHLDGGMSAIKS